MVQQPATPRTILLVDVEKFSDYSRTDSQRLAVHDHLYDLLEKALREAEIDWDNCHREDRGDGVLILAPPTIPKACFSAYLPGRLIDALRQHNRAHPVEENIRLRLALHAGEVFFDDHGVVASAVNRTFRLLESEPLRKALRDSADPLAMIATTWFYDEVIRGSPESHQEDYFPVLINAKETREVGWITTPGRPSRSQPWHIRLLDSDGKIHGPGILLRGRYALTTVQAVARALRTQSIAARPSGQVAFDLPARPELGVQRAEIIWWRPDLPGGSPVGLDLAGLSIVGPVIRGIDEPVFLLDWGSDPRIVRLRACSISVDDQHEQPRWSRLPERSEKGQERVPLDRVTDTAPDINSECHGSDVIDEQTGEILGMAMISNSVNPGGHAWMTPVGKIMSEWPLLRRIVPPGRHDGPSASRPRACGRADILSLVDDCLRVPALANAQSRHQLVSELSPDVNLSSPRSSVDRADLTALLWSCTQVPGALIELASMIRESSHGRKPAADVANDLERLHEQLLPRFLPYVTIPVAGG